MGTEIGLIFEERCVLRTNRSRRLLLLLLWTQPLAALVLPLCDGCSGTGPLAS